MEYPIDQNMPENDFIQLLVEKANIIKNHLRDRQSELVIYVNIGPNMATFKLFHKNEEDSLKLHFTLSNLGDIDEQLHQLWQQVNFVLKQYCAHCQRVNTENHS